MVYSSKLKKNILVTGKTSRFCKYLIENENNFNFFFTSKKNFNILDFEQMNDYLKQNKIDYLIHIAGLSRPMKIHEKKISLSIDLNIIGTANIVKVCEKFKIKLIYFSTNYVYPGITGNYKEDHPLKPVNNYAWSKLGGEACVHLYKNSLILRICMTDYPFTHKKAIKGAKTSFVFNKFVSQMLPLFINEKGVLNVGGNRRDIYEFAKKHNNKIRPISFTKIKNFPKDSSVNINKLKKILKENNFKINGYNYSSYL
tara:strand:+ start:11148 stop:11915 length:768 start_codon:yes stop_codon:yes gene_type:complete